MNILEVKVVSEVKKYPPLQMQQKDKEKNL